MSLILSLALHRILSEFLGDAEFGHFKRYVVVV